MQMLPAIALLLMQSYPSSSSDFASETALFDSPGPGGRARAAPIDQKLTIYEQDVAFALDEIEKQCGTLLQLKEVDWKAVRKDFTAEAKQVKDDQAHLVLLTRLLARVRDGHATVTATEKTRDLKWPDRPEVVGCG